ncbi:MAG: hypothetical protein U0935_04145 [Pirellulales bacterium]
MAAIIDSDAAATHLPIIRTWACGSFVEVDYTEPDVKYIHAGRHGGQRS